MRPTVNFHRLNASLGGEFSIGANPRSREPISMHCPSISFSTRAKMRLLLPLFVAATRSLASPASLEAEVATSSIASHPLAGPTGGSSAISSRSVTASLLERKAVGAEGWYLAGGVQAEKFFFSTGSAVPRQLQDYAAVLALEYFRGDENVAALTMRPGWYFDRRPVAESWDVPFDLVSGVPLTREINGVIGVSNARFYHHALPIIGLIAPLGRRIQLQLVFPEPALIYSTTSGSSWRLRGELTGAGFLSHSPAGRSAVEYSSYLVGIEFRQIGPGGREFALSAGVEAVSNFDFFREQRRLHGGGAAYLKFRAKYSR